MVLLTLSDFHGTEHTAAGCRGTEPAQALLQTLTEAEYLAALPDSSAADLRPFAELGSRLLVPEPLADLFPEAGLVISSAISGGDLRTRFQELAEHRTCWLLPQPMCTVFSLPCPDGQGVPAGDPPEEPGFYSEALGCRYVHRPGQVILFDTPQTMEQKILLAEACGFAGVISGDQP